jgi:hypothetical protein
MSELEYLKGKLREHMNDLADHMAGGGCSNFDHYQYSVGMVKGFAIMEREILDLEERMNNAE